MRPMLLVLVAMCAAPLVAAENKFPYKAFINTDEVYVRSGPGQSYYPTDKLAIGQEVEVYRHDPGGWYAVRPVEGSFCWVNTRFLELKSDGIAEVKADDVACRVGSRFSDVRDIIGVKLKKGELIELVDERELRRSDNAWCRIAPPPGDFRWVYAKYVDPDYPRDGLRKPRHGHHGPETPEPEVVAAPVAPSVLSTPLPDGPLSPEQFRREIEAIELELAIVLAEEPEIWSFASLRKRSEALLERADAAVERGHARVLLGKIDRYEGIKQRYESIELAREETERTARLFSGVRTAQRAMVPPPQPANRFDGKGRLIEVRAAKPGSPRYALVDERGSITTYVTPSPGMNLRPYVGKQVGITGTRGYVPDQKSQHLMARHIGPAEGSVMR